MCPKFKYSKRQCQAGLLKKREEKQRKKKMKRIYRALLETQSVLQQMRKIQSANGTGKSKQKNSCWFQLHNIFRRHQMLSVSLSLSLSLSVSVCLSLFLLLFLLLLLFYSQRSHKVTKPVLLYFPNSSGIKRRPHEQLTGLTL